MILGEREMCKKFILLSHSVSALDKIDLMQEQLHWLKKHWLWVAVIGFVVSRLYIFLNPPPYVRYFEEYANIWYYGLPPYLKHLFEYPPATIPFISGPLLLDLAGIGKYRLNFRLMMLVVDVMLYGLVVLTLRKMKYSPAVKLANVAFYLLLTIKAKDFMYENLDPLFTLTLFLPAVAPLLMNKGKDFVQWIMYWLGTGIKLVNAPLGLLYFFQMKLPFIKKMILIGVTCLLIWGLPLAIYRSSLSVMLVYHKNRVIQVESCGAPLNKGHNKIKNKKPKKFKKHKKKN
jgi:hypothetical protein